MPYNCRNFTSHSSDVPVPESLSLIAQIKRKGVVVDIFPHHDRIDKSLQNDSLLPENIKLAIFDATLSVACVKDSESYYEEAHLKFYDYLQKGVEDNPHVKFILTSSVSATQLKAMRVLGRATEHSILDKFIPNDKLFQKIPSILSELNLLDSPKVQMLEQRHGKTWKESSIRGY